MKMLVTSNITFSHNVFRMFLSQGRLKLVLCGKGLNLYIFTTKSQAFTTIRETVSENIVRKGENTGNLFTDRNYHLGDINFLSANASLWLGQKSCLGKGLIDLFYGV